MLTPQPPDRGTPEIYEVVWMSGHVETVPAHQVSYPGNAAVLFGGRSDLPRRIELHAEINGRWLLTLSALEEDIRTMRLVTCGEPIPGEVTPSAD